MSENFALDKEKIFYITPKTISPNLDNFKKLKINIKFKLLINIKIAHNKILIVEIFFIF
jgi:hypothetical protein